MTKHLTQDCFDKLWKNISGLYPTQSAIKTFMAKGAFKWEKVELIGTGEEMIHSLLSLAEKEERIPDILTTALDPNEFPDDAVLKEIQAALNDHSAYLPDISDEGLIVPAAGEPVNVMLIYDQKDNEIVSELGDHLYPLDEYLKIIKVFDMHTDPEVSGGADAKDVIDRKLKETQIALLLLTPDFFGKKNGCFKLGIDAFNLKKRVIPVLLKPCIWDRISLLENIVPLPRNKEFVSLWKNTDEALMNIAKEIEAVANVITKKT